MIIPEEAECLLPMLWNGTNAGTHLIAYAAPVTKMMRHFSDMRYLAIPALPDDYRFPGWVTIMAGILGGRMYFGPKELNGFRAFLDETETELEAEATTSSDLKGFVLDWSALRRSNRDIAHTPTGYLCLGKKLEKDHPFFAL